MRSLLASTVMTTKKTVQQRFWEKVDIRGEEECWPWLAYRNPSDYGKFSYEGVPKGAHRVSFFLTNGYWPNHVDHTCTNPPCQNPAHLEDVSNSENGRRTTLRGRHTNMVKTECPQGHPYDDTNTRWSTRGNGKKFRVCRLCSLAETHRRRGPEKKTHSGPRRIPPDLHLP